MARPATSDELALFRKEGQFLLLKLALPASNIVFQAMINQNFDSLDSVVQVVYDTVTTGAYTDILPGMCIWFGDTIGSYNRGFARVRKAPTSDTLYIGEESELDLKINLYITVVDDFLIWPRNLIINSSKVPLMDYDVAY